MPLMFHPKLSKRRPTPTSIQAFVNVWEKKGWKLITEYEELGNSPIAYYANFTLAELREEASNLDIPGRSKMNRDELTAALIEANTFA